LERIQKEYDVIGHPRLVRLNPNVPWKTRGNGAVCFQIGEGHKKKIKIGQRKNKDIFSYSLLKSDVCIHNYPLVAELVQKTIEEFAQLNDMKTNPGFVIFKHQPKKEMYKKAVTSVVSVKETIRQLDVLKAYYKGYKNKRGLIGAAASVAWRPVDKTFEVISYRKPYRWGTKRRVDESSVILMDKQTSKTFDNFDYIHNHSRITPNSPCPILFGIRGDDPLELLDSLKMITSESFTGFLLFETNQGTDEHLQNKKISEVKPFESVTLEGVISENPYTIRGGHVLFAISDETGSIDCACYEPTKEFRQVIRELRCGDVVEVVGGLRKKPLTVNLEKINILSLKKIVEKIENPLCPQCKKHMKSIGLNQGFRCKICGNKSNDAVLKEKPRLISLGWYEAPVCARRHLSKPLKRII
jgi:tRNA(Ile2)-agmatinylcytidine synthase